MMDPLSCSRDDYVAYRFEHLPREVIEYLGLSNDDAKATLEVLFRGEYFRLRHDALEKMLLKAYRKYMAARAVIGRFALDVDGEIDGASEDIGDFSEIPTEF